MTIYVLGEHLFIIRVCYFKVKGSVILRSKSLLMTSPDRVMVPLIFHFHSESNEKKTEGS